MVGMIKAQFHHSSQGTVFYPYPFLAGRVVPPGREDTIRGEVESSR